MLANNIAIVKLYYPHLSFLSLQNKNIDNQIRNHSTHWSNEDVPLCRWLVFGGILPCPVPDARGADEHLDHVGGRESLY